jgi:type 2A phosphatase activator TIP41
MDYYKAGPWEITTNQGIMMGSEALEGLGHELGFKIPSLVYSNTYSKLQHRELPFAFEINTKHALELIGLETRSRVEESSSHPPFIPKEVKVHCSSHWENRTIPKSSTFSEDSKEQVAAPIYNPGSDWTFTTLYKGSAIGSCRQGPTGENIPIDRLGIENPILWASEIVIYEDELDDNGLCKLSFRIRAMQDCLFALLRFYLRVDHVLVRICDTRIFSDFKENSILREFQVKEASYEELRAGGVDVGASWNLNPRQSDLIFPHLGLVHCVKDKIEF